LLIDLQCVQSIIICGFALPPSAKCRDVGIAIIPPPEQISFILIVNRLSATCISLAYHYIYLVYHV